MKRKLLFTVISAFGMNALATSYIFQGDKGQVSFLAKARPALISINGTGQGIKGTLVEIDGKIGGEIEFRLDNLQTGIKLRDEHMKNKYLQTDLYPVATLKLDKIAIPPLGSGTFPFTGALKLHGVEQPIRGDFVVEQDRGQHKVSAQFGIQISKFKIDLPSFQGASVAEDVQVKVEAFADKRE